MDGFYKERSLLYEIKVDDFHDGVNVVASDIGTKSEHDEGHLKSL